MQNHSRPLLVEGPSFFRVPGSKRLRCSVNLAGFACSGHVLKDWFANAKGPLVVGTVWCLYFAICCLDWWCVQEYISAEHLMFFILFVSILPIVDGYCWVLVGRCLCCGCACHTRCEGVSCKIVVWLETNFPSARMHSTWCGGRGEGGFFKHERPKGLPNVLKDSCGFSAFKCIFVQIKVWVMGHVM